MAITKKTGITGLSSRKEVRKIITLQLENALSGLKKELGEDKFNLRLKKAVKVLTRDFEGAHAIEDASTPEKAPIAEKVPLKVKKAAAKKSVKKKAVKAHHPGATSKLH
jgi:hypothetical protein